MMSSQPHGALQDLSYRLALGRAVRAVQSQCKPRQRLSAFSANNTTTVLLHLFLSSKVLHPNCCKGHNIIVVTNIGLHLSLLCVNIFTGQTELKKNPARFKKF